VDLGQAIRVMLAKRQVSQTTLAKEVDVTRPYMSSLCNNERVPSFRLLERISNSLDCKLSELIAGGEE
jgi:DNA-binding Xre family transcriptional regulator